MKKINFFLILCLFLVLFTPKASAFSVVKNNVDLISRSKTYITQFNNNDFISITYDIEKESKINFDTLDLEYQWSDLVEYGGVFQEFSNVKVEEKNGFIYVDIVSKHSIKDFRTIFIYTKNKKLHEIRNGFFYLEKDEKETFIKLALYHNDLLKNGQFEEFYRSCSSEYKQEMSLKRLTKTYSKNKQNFGYFLNFEKISTNIVLGDFINVFIIDKYEKNYMFLDFIYNQNYEIISFKMGIPTDNELHSNVEDFFPGVFTVLNVLNDFAKQ